VVRAIVECKYRRLKETYVYLIGEGIKKRDVFKSFYLLAQVLLDDDTQRKSSGCLRHI
jgi:hypothetical protein